MNEFHYFVVGTLLLVTLISIILSYQYRTKMQSMTPMVISMAISMNIGVTSGILFGFIYQGDLFLSSLISVLIGISVGVAAGFAFGILPVIEGSMAGMMGGMMGAMLGEMISRLQAVSLLNIFLTITVSTLFLYLILSQQKATEDTRVFTSWLLKPIFTLIVLVGYFYFGNQLNKESVISKESPIHENHSQIPTDDKDEQLNRINIQVNPSNFSYSPSRINLSKNKKVLLTFTNHDSIEHDIVIVKMPTLPNTDQENISSHGSHDSHGDGLHLHANPHEEGNISFTPTETGTYEFYCSLPGHRENGMVGIIVVE
ncbi:plastocyanin/azurin family copper-binding protein [Bacillus sp. ISL-39]|uniref:plastocyanin/azurin family copper-binding protein n=1 Tax=Bacillus sp. ISL-39 TaxID=2819124 RepID=UPI001BED1601|nr:plastocyanin/azurin family copper-binding protein [Bacillus sp. ISL-39]MBT2640198.1 cupredoxin domain-containing protein [Bacillus sp. ISL-39]